jgi:hypothetical protein
MAELKTKVNDKDVNDFILEFADTDQKKQDAFHLLKYLEDISGHPPKMWGGSIIGYGEYFYKSDRSAQKGDWPLLGFSPRKAAISLYIYMPTPENDELLKELGKFKMGKACIYVKKVSDINLDVFKKISLNTIAFLKEKYPA